MTSHTSQTRKVRLAYGKQGLEIEVPSQATVIEPRYVPAFGGS